MAAQKSMWLRLSSSVLHLRMAVWLSDTFNVGGYLVATRGLHSSPANVQRRVKRDKSPEFVNSAAMELGVTKYFCNRNPRSLELLGIAEKPRGFATKKSRMDFYHRYAKHTHAPSYIIFIPLTTFPDSPLAFQLHRSLGMWLCTLILSYVLLPFLATLRSIKIAIFAAICHILV